MVLEKNIIDIRITECKGMSAINSAKIGKMFQNYHQDKRRLLDKIIF
jgi:hypothetical protein